MAGTTIESDAKETVNMGGSIAVFLSCGTAIEFPFRCLWRLEWLPTNSLGKLR